MKILSLSPHFFAWHFPLGTFDNFQLFTKVTEPVEVHFQLIYKEQLPSKRQVEQTTADAVKYKYRFQGQEYEDELGKNTYAYQWRDYDPAIARFNKIDRFAEKYFSHTPYNFAANNPIMFVDIKGDSINVAEKYQEEFNKVLEAVFGEKASNFSYKKVEIYFTRDLKRTLKELKGKYIKSY